MAKLKIKNTQLAKALKIKGAKLKPVKQKEPEKAPPQEEEVKPHRKVKAREKSAFAEVKEEPKAIPPKKEEAASPPQPEPVKAAPLSPEEEKQKQEMERRAQIQANIRTNLAQSRERTTKKKPEAAAPRQSSTETAPPKEGRGKEKRKMREFRDFKPRLGPAPRPFDARDRHGLRDTDEGWRRRRRRKAPIKSAEIPAVRPTKLNVRLPITIKDLAAAMKLKASELITKLFLQGMTLTLNDALDDDTTIGLLGHEFGCEIAVDTSEDERIRITDQTVKEEIAAANPENLQPRSPVVAFMGHVDHGKTSLIDKIRKSNVAAGEAGAITQHIGAFQCQTDVGNITILDTPGHEAFTSMRARGAEVTDVVILVIAGDEGVRPQTEEAIQHAKAAGVTILVAINKCDKPEFNAENIYRQLSDLELLPESWGGGTITVNCSAVTGEGIPQLLEMIALQTEILELKGDPTTRARGTVIESEMHKGLGVMATVLIQNGTLRRGDSLVFTDLWGRVKTMQDEFGKNYKEAGPGAPIAITGLSGLPQAGSTFIVVENEKEAAAIAEARAAVGKQALLLKRKKRMAEALLEGPAKEKKTLRLILRADVQGSLEALKNSLEKIESDKADVDVIFSGVGAISESDVELAVASNAVILGFHTQVESHAEPYIKRHQVQIRLHDIIYHAIDEVKEIMTGRLEKIAEEKETGAAVVRVIFKASAFGVIAGCFINDGIISRNHKVRLIRDGEQIWMGSIASIRREKEDVKEVRAGLECGILLDGFNKIEEGDILQAFEIIYLTQKL